MRAFHRHDDSLRGDMPQTLAQKGIHTWNPKRSPLFECQSVLVGVPDFQVRDPHMGHATDFGSRFLAREDT